MRKKRLFIAIPLSENIREMLASVSCYYSHPALRWTPAENLHITAHFIGIVPESELNDIRNNIAQLARSEQPFSLTFSELKVIARRKKPVMVWAAFDNSAAFTRLAVQLQHLLPGDDSKAPLPHVTLARVKNDGLRELPVLPFVKKFVLHVQQIELWESVLGNSAPVYKSLEQFPLGK